MKIEIINKTVEQFCKEYIGKKFHALLCDPPYELGFMGKHWDRSGIVFKPETWAMLAQHLHPGAFGFSFASSRGWHRLACAIEDAGNVFHPSVFMAGWSAGSGFPKATRISNQIDKNAKVEKPKIKLPYSSNMLYQSNGKNSRPWLDRAQKLGYHEKESNEPVTDLAKTWSGHRYGLQALKPALEPILCWQKPYEGKAVDSITKTGAGALNVDEGRVGKPFDGKRPLYKLTSKGAKGGAWSNKEAPKMQRLDGEAYGNPLGRWPANLVLSHSPDCTPKKCVEGCAVEMLDRQSGETSGSDRPRNNKARPASVAKGAEYDRISYGFSDTGGASRFFFNADYLHEKIEFSEVVEQQIANADPIKYQAKAGRSEREAGLIHNIPCIHCKDLHTDKHITHNGKKVYNIALAGSDGIPTIDEINSMWKSYKRNNRQSELPKWMLSDCNRCDHPTVKPISLAQHLATLLLPPIEYSPRRILIPFSGSGSEIIGAMLAGWDEIVAVEMEPEYVEIAQERVAWWQNIYEKLGAQGVKDILEKFAKEEPEEVREAKKKQMDLF